MSKLAKFVAPAATALGTWFGGPVGGALGGLLGKSVGDALKKPEVPEIPEPAVMPDANDEAVKAARRRKIAEVQARSGRASTILSQADTLGG